MDKDDQNYQLMLDKQIAYIATIKAEALSKAVEVSQWEIEEIEMAFEHGFAQGFVSGYQSLREHARERTH